MDNTYLSRSHIRRKYIEDERKEIIACTPQGAPAVMELYDWLIGIYLPRRFPTIYTLVSESNTTGAPTHLKNHATNKLLTLTPETPEIALEIIGENIDSEFFILEKPLDSSSSPSPAQDDAQPQSQSQEEKETQPYRLTAFVNCFPAGFRTLSKLGLTLSGIHGPVPHYSEKLEKSMDRYFAALPVGKVVKRVNWGIATTPNLFKLGGHHMSAAEHEKKKKEEEEGKKEVNPADEVDIEQVVLRCERQTLHRMPKSGSLVFAFKVCFPFPPSPIPPYVFFSLPHKRDVANPLNTDIHVPSPRRPRRRQRPRASRSHRRSGPRLRTQNHSVQATGCVGGKSKGVFEG